MDPVAWENADQLVWGDTDQYWLTAVLSSEAQTLENVIDWCQANFHETLHGYSLDNRANVIAMLGFAVNNSPWASWMYDSGDPDDIWRQFREIQLQLAVVEDEISHMVVGDNYIPDAVTAEMGVSAHLVENSPDFPASFFPDLDVTANILLEEIAGSVGTTDVVVLPDNAPMSGVNTAITIKRSMTIGAYQGFAEAQVDSGQLPVNIAKLNARIHLDSILLKASLVRQGGIDLYGQLAHEYGHVKNSSIPEYGLVFVTELQALQEKYGNAEVRMWVLNRRTLAYLARYPINPGVAAMEAILQEVLEPTEFAEYQRLRLVAHPK